jgi:polyisoprenoid-binding protein YceI
MVSGFIKRVVASSLAAALLAVPAMAQNWQVDPVHSSIFFKVKHVGASWAYGLIHAPTGKVVFDPANPTASSLEITAKVANVDTGSENRDKHLKSNDFFAGGQHPNITFKSTSWKPAGENKFEVAGDLTLRGETKPITVTLELTGTGKDRQGTDVAGFETTFTIKRSDFGVNGAQGGVGDEVTLSVSLEVVKA